MSNIDIYLNLERLAILTVEDSSNSIINPKITANYKQSNNSNLEIINNEIYILLSSTYDYYTNESIKLNLFLFKKSEKRGSVCLNKTLLIFHFKRLIKLICSNSFSRL